MKFHVNDSCIGCGLCVSTCPEVFHMNDEEMAVAMDGDVPDSEVDAATEAKEGCPVEAIESED